MYLKKYLNQTEEIKNKKADVVISENTKGSMTGAVIGAGVGLYVGYSRQYNLLMSGFVGSLIGVFVSKAFNK